MGHQDYPFELGKDPESRFPPKLLIVASEKYVGQLEAKITPQEREGISFLPVGPNADVPKELLTKANCVVVEIDQAVPESLERLNRIRRDAPNLPQVVALAGATLALVRTMLKQGVADVVSLPFDTDELLQASISAVEAAAARGPETGSLAPAIAVVGSLGGIGATTIASNLADELGRSCSDKRGACLIDLDVQFGSVAPMIGLAPRRGLHDLLVSGNRLDGAFLRSVATKHSDHLHVIAAPDEIAPLESVETDQLLQVLDYARSEFDFVVMDLPANWTSWNLSAVLAANLVLVVVSLEIASLRQARRELDLFRSAGVDPKRIAVVVNRMEKRLFRVIGLDEVNKALDLPIIGSVHRDSQLLANAQDQGLLARQAHKKAQFVSDIEALADAVAKRFEADEEL